jgi:hypothetical protein
MPNMPPGGENKSSHKGMKKESGHPKSVAGIEDHNHAGERGHQDGVVFRLPKDSDCTDHSKVRELG